MAFDKKTCRRYNPCQKPYLVAGQYIVALHDYTDRALRRVSGLACPSNQRFSLRLKHHFRLQSLKATHPTQSRR
jgi:hypothetical protein